MITPLPQFSCICFNAVDAIAVAKWAEITPKGLGLGELAGKELPTAGNGVASVRHCFCLKFLQACSCGSGLAGKKLPTPQVLLPQ